MARRKGDVDAKAQKEHCCSGCIRMQKHGGEMRDTLQFCKFKFSNGTGIRTHTNLSTAEYSSTSLYTIILHIILL